MVPGVKMNIGGREFEVPPLNIRLLRVHQATLDELTNPEKVKTLGVNGYALKAVTVVTAALQRNYPQLTAEEVEELLPVAEVPSVVRALFKVSGFEGDGKSPLEQPLPSTSP